MKRFYSLPFLCLLMFVFIGCDNSSKDVDLVDELTLDLNQAIEVVNTATTTEVWFLTNTDWEATISPADEGATISPMSGGYGTNYVTVDIDENLGYEDRSFFVTVTAGSVQRSIEIIQSTAYSILDADVDELVFESAGGDLTFNLTYNMDYVVELADTLETWLSLPATKAYGTDQITVSTEANPDGHMRESMVYIYSTEDYQAYADSVIIYQKGSNVLDLSSNDFVAAVDGDTCVVSYLFDDESVYEIEEALSWISYTMVDEVDLDEDGVVDEGMAGVEFLVSANNTGAYRTGTVVFSKSSIVYDADGMASIVTTSQDILFSQDQNNVLYASRYDMSSLSGEADSIFISFSANVDYEVSIPASASSWMSEGGGSSIGSLNLILTANDSGASRADTVTVSAIDYEGLSFQVVVTQSEQFVIELVEESTLNTLVDTLYSAPVSGVERYIKVCHNLEFDDDAASTSWFSLQYVTENSTDQTITYKLTVDPFEYTGTFDRSSSLSFYTTNSPNVLTIYISQSYNVEVSKGTLNKTLEDAYGSDYKSTVRGLSISGEINSTDLATISSMNALVGLNMSQVSITGSIELNDSTTLSVSALPMAWLKGNSSLTSIVFPEGLEIIGESAFEGSSITSDLVFPSTLTTISDAAFRDCAKLTGAITFSEVLETIGYEAFSGCTSMTGDLYMPNTITSLGERAFYNCSSVNGLVKLPRGISVIEESTFENCSSLSGGIYIPANILEIRKNAFKGCSGAAGELTFLSSLVFIGESAFENCSNLTGSITIPSTTTEIETRAFMGCESLTGLTLTGSGINKINDKVFANCKSMTGTLSIPNTITEIGNYAFYRCESFTGTLTFRATWTSIGEYAFYGCQSITGSMTFPASLTYIGRSAFAYCSGAAGTLTLSTGLEELPEELFYMAGFKNNLTLTSGLTTIRKNALTGTSQSGALYVSTDLEVFEEQENGLAFTSVYLYWNEMPDEETGDIVRIPTDAVTNILNALGNQFRTSLYDITAEQNIIYVPFGYSHLYTALPIFEDYKVVELEE